MGKERLKTAINSQRSCFCGYCRNQISSFRNLKVHIQEQHPEETDFKREFIPGQQKLSFLKPNQNNAASTSQRQQPYPVSRQPQNTYSSNETASSESQIIPLEEEISNPLNDSITNQNIASGPFNEETPLSENTPMPSSPSLPFVPLDGNGRDEDNLSLIDEIGIDETENQSESLDNEAYERIFDKQSRVPTSLDRDISEESALPTSRITLSNECRPGTSASAMDEEILKRLETMQINQNKIMEKLGVNSSPNVGAFKVPQRQEVPQLENDNISLAKFCRSLVSFIEYLPNFEPHYPSRESIIMDGISCSVCVSSCPYNSSEHSHIPGVIHYDPRDGLDFAKTEMPQSFRSMKKVAIEHLSSSGHKNKCQEKAKLTSEQKKQSKANKQVAETLLATCYKAIYTNKSQASYENELAFLSSVGVPVGDIRHSRKFCAKSTPTFYKLLKAELRLQSQEILPGTNRPSPISLEGDKYTTNRRTLDIVASTEYRGGTMNFAFLSCGVVKDHTGFGVAKQFKDAADEVYGQGTWNPRFVGTAVDGAIVRVNFAKHLNAMIYSMISNKDGPEFISANWDSAHCLELADMDATKLHSWKAEIQSIVSTTNKKYRYGKNFEELVDEAEETAKEAGTKARLWRSPRLFSNTRWATYSKEVYENFEKNYTYLYKCLNRSTDKQLDKINTIAVITNTSGLLDIYRIVSKLSLTTQEISLYNWQLYEVLDEHKSNLAKISNALSSSRCLDEIKSLEGSDGKKLLPSLSSAIEEILSKHTYQGLPILDVESRPIASSTRQVSQSQSSINEGTEVKVKTLCLKIGAFAKSLDDAITDRFNRPLVKQVINEEAGTLFSMNKILQRDFNEVPSVLASYARKARASGFLEEHFSDEELSRQYRKFSKDVKEGKTESYTNAPFAKKRKIEKSYYEDLIFGRPTPKDYPEIIHLLAGSTLRLSNESLVEGMASSVKRHSEGRGSLNPTTLSNEAFISINGPEPNQNAKTLVTLALKSMYGPEIDNINLTRKSRSDKLKNYFVSQVIDRKNFEGKGHIEFQKEREFSEYNKLFTIFEEEEKEKSRLPEEEEEEEEDGDVPRNNFQEEEGVEEMIYEQSDSDHSDNSDNEQNSNNSLPILSPHDSETENNFYSNQFQRSLVSPNLYPPSLVSTYTQQSIDNSVSDESEMLERDTCL